MKTVHFFEANCFIDFKTTAVFTKWYKLHTLVNGVHNLQRFEVASRIFFSATKAVLALFSANSSLGTYA